MLSALAGEKNSMCGIVGAAARRDVSGILLEGLQRLEYRGYDSAGLAVEKIDAGSGDAQIESIRRLGKVRELKDACRSTDISGNLGIAHTRWATHGKPSEANAHPHMSADSVALVHNGIIENHETLRQQLKKDGYEFVSETDTEVVVHLIQQQVAKCGNFRQGVTQALEFLEGAYAIGVIHKDFPGQVIAARAGSPLVVGLGIGENFIASDPLALRPVTDRFIFLEEGEIVEMTADEISIFGVGSESVESRTVRLDQRNDSTDKGQYRHYMLKEIFEQPDTVRQTLEGRISDKHVLAQAFGLQAGAVFEKTNAIQIVACGTSYYSALVARYWMESLAGIPCQVEIASEFRYRETVVLPGTLLVTLSQSGETADTLAALKAATDKNYLASLCICNARNSSLVRASDLFLMMEAGPEIGVASTKAFVAQLCDLLLLTLAIAKLKGLPEADEIEMVAALKALPEQLEKTLALNDRIKTLAEDFVDKEHVLFLGRGSHFPIALEGALKLKEISYIHAEGYAAGELKHGPLALVDDHMPVVAVAPNNELLEKLKSNLNEVRSRGAKMYIFVDHSVPFEADEHTVLIKVPESHRITSPIVHTLPLQLLSYHVAVLKGTDVDQPRNLAKSVTVE